MDAVTWTGRSALEAMAEGESRAFKPPEGSSAITLRRQLCVVAHRLWGRGSYQTAIEGETVRLTRRIADQAEPASAAPALSRANGTEPSPADEQGWLDREAAAAYCRGKGLSHVTGAYLRKLAGSPRGPLHHRMGRFAYYRRQDLEEWMNRTIRPVLAGQQPPRAA